MKLSRSAAHRIPPNPMVMALWLAMMRIFQRQPEQLRIPEVD